VDPTTEFVVGLFLLVACAVLAGELVSRLGHSALVGQLAVGIVFGPTLLGPTLGLTGIASEFAGLEVLATFFVLMTAGLAITPRQIGSTGLGAALLGIAVFVTPFLLGTVVVHLLYPGLAPLTSLFVALTISVTALPVLGVMLAELGLGTSRFGVLLLNGALVNELAAVTTFSVLLRWNASGGGDLALSTSVAVVTVGLFLSSILAIHHGLASLRRLRIWDRWVAVVRQESRSRELGFAILMVGGLGAALYSQALGLTFLVGAFYAGLLVSPESIGLREHRQLSRVFDAVTWGFFIPLFFALVGFGMNLRSLADSPTTLLAFTALCGFALASKVVVGGAVARSLGWSSRESVAAGFFLTSRGAVELAMATILLSLGIFSRPTFTIVAGVGLVTTFLSPLGARRFLRARVRPVGGLAQPQRWRPIPEPDERTGAPLRANGPDPE
jgi:Kef-type K+ transport system membrane component KefB